MDFIKVGIVIMAIVLTIGISEYQSHKPVDLSNKIVLIKPQEVLKKLFVRSGVIVPKDGESVSETPESDLKSIQNTVRMVSRGVPREASGQVKTYMGFKSITSKNSLQYKLQQECYTDAYAFRRFGEFYCVAMGKFYSDHVGSKFVITFDTGVQIKVITGDVKMAQHTDDSLRYVEENGNIIEFIMDSRRLEKLVKLTGDVSNSGNGLMGGKITKIEEIVEE